MNPSEVIKLDAQKNGVDPNALLVAVQNIIQQGGFVLSQGNTALVMKKISPAVYEAHLFTHDAPLALAQAITKFFHQMKDKGVHRVYGQKPRNPEIVSLLKIIAQRVGAQVTDSDLPKYYWMAII